MTTGLQLALAGGALVASGAALLVIRLLPAEPDLADALGRLTPSRPRRIVSMPATSSGGKERIGVWAIRAAPAGCLGADPDPRAGAAAHPAGAVLRRQAHLRVPWPGDPAVAGGVLRR